MRDERHAGSAYHAGRKTPYTRLFEEASVRALIVVGSVLVAAVSICASAPSVAASASSMAASVPPVARLNPVIGLLEQKTPVFGLYAPSNRRFPGAQPAAAPEPLQPVAQPGAGDRPAARGARAHGAARVRHRRRRRGGAHRAGAARGRPNRRGTGNRGPALRVGTTLRWPRGTFKNASQRS